MGLTDPNEGAALAMKNYASLTRRTLLAAIPLAALAPLSGCENSPATAKKPEVVAKEIQWLKDNRVVSASDSYKSEDQLSRAGMADLIYKLVGSPEAEASFFPFADVEAISPGAKAIPWLSAYGLAWHDAHRNYRPGDQATQGEMVSTLKELLRPAATDT